MPKRAEYYTVDHPLYDAIVQGWTVNTVRSDRDVRRGHVKVVYPGSGVVIETDGGGRYAIRTEDMEILERAR